MTLHELNTLSKQQLITELANCCGSTAWVYKMLPFFPADDLVELLEDAEEQWYQCSPIDWKEAFARHSKVNDTVTASPQIIQELATANQQYEKMFGYTFIVADTGQSAEEILLLLKERLSNDPADEIEIAADEQNKITRQRIEKLLDE
ncbi:MAG: 2-oxo-4-hydroxy-4-carboxy-5-ureidoimidazoline decarboxylase [Chitinophagaceae bacterium]